MGRNLKPLYRDTVSNSWFARFLADNKTYRLSLNTTDEAEAYKRFPVVQQARMSWNQYQKTLSGLNTLVVNAIDNHRITPGLTMPASSEALSKLISEAAATGQANFDQERAFWVVRALTGGLPTDATAMPAPLISPSSNALIQGADILKAITLTDDWKEMENFYCLTMEQVFLDKSRVKRTGGIWLDFLRQNNVRSWNQITEDLMIRYKDWRKTVSIARGRNSKVTGKPCSAETLNRDIQFLSKSFDETVARKFMSANPVRNWVPENHIVQRKKPLSIQELKNILDKLTVTVRNVVILLYCSCKRRKEISSLQIEDVNFKNHYVHYTEFKNSSRSDSIEKAFFITPDMEHFLKKIIGNRRTCSLWPEKFHPDRISHQFEEVAAEVAPAKNATLKNLRQCATDVMEKAGLIDQEIDATLGHISVSKALPFYKDRSPDAVYRRLAEQTRKGVTVLSKSIEDYLK